MGAVICLILMLVATLIYRPYIGYSDKPCKKHRYRLIGKRVMCPVCRIVFIEDITKVDK
jgi:hypothetical protein